ncbi:hypothetical protein AAG570_009068 [Ranatra chinensis]|uniref:AAA+ ATPase domain-containing protein n=1 Tax=Ranatra chinensis TaxID=642074 RepID=A0ABD0YSS4_9HEMI
MFHKNKTQETTENGRCNLPPFCDENIFFAHTPNNLRSRDKPLVLSFHGMPGTGKNYIAEFILKNMFKEGSRSQFAHFYSAHLDFPDSMEKHTYQKKLEQEIEASIYKCHRSIFVFDEVEKMPNGLLEVLSPYAEGWKNVDGIDYKKVVFIFLSNTAQLYIRDVLNYHHKNGKLRDELKMRHFKDLPRLAFRDKGGLHRTTLISSDLISQYVPFLPIDACHAEKCIVHEINKINQTVSYNLIQEVLSNMHFEGRFSSGGCKLIDAIVLREVFMQSLKLTGVH